MHRDEAPPLTQAISVVWAERCPSSSFRLLFPFQCSVSCLLAFTPTFPDSKHPPLWSVPSCWSAQYKGHLLQKVSCVPTRPRVVFPFCNNTQLGATQNLFPMLCEKLQDCGSHMEPPMGWKIREHARSVRLTFLQRFRADMGLQAN